MASPGQTCDRLLAAVEDLVAQETLLLRASDFEGVLATQERAAPLVERLTSLVSTADATLRGRLEAVLAQRSRSLEWLGREMGRVQGEVQAMQIGLRRLAQLAPVYGARSAQAQFQAQG